MRFMTERKNISYKKQLGTYPEVKYCPQYDPSGYGEIRALCFDGVPFNGKKTKVFAYMGLPGKITEPAPAVVLVHGGGCHPDCEWIRKWTALGYIALAPETTGYFPAEPHTSFCESRRGLWRHLVPGDLAEDGYTAPPDNSGMKDTGIDPENRWMYHAVSQVILAHNILLKDERVDHDKIGISGISWGGVITSAAIGTDRRFAFAVPIYGSAFLAEGLSRIDEPFRLAENREWLAENRYDGLKMPIMWLCWNDDCCFSINSNSDSYIATAKHGAKTVLSMRHLMYHSHTNAYNCAESYWFADRILNGKEIPKIDCCLTAGRLSFECSEKGAEIRLFYIAGKMEYTERVKYGIKNCFMKQDWEIVNIEPDAKSIELPQNAGGFYLEFKLPDGIVLCSPFFNG